MAISNTTVLISRKGMGEADVELHTPLIQAYLRTLNEADEQPAEMCF